MLRRAISAAAVSLAVTAGLMTAATPPATSATFDNSIGYVKAPTQRWHGKCAKYTIRWQFYPPTDEWTVIARIRTPKGFSIRSEFWDSNSPNILGRKRGKKPVELCGSSIKPGRYKIEMQMIYSEGRDNYTVRRAPTYFRLVRR